jgi:hypothetical protein
VAHPVAKMAKIKAATIYFMNNGLKNCKVLSSIFERSLWQIRVHE